jgi:chromosome segregation ATPase
MKSFFTKLSVLLFGVAFAVAGCQDYDEDIRKVNDQLNANTAELTSITDALDKAIKDLEAKMVADYATKKALADLSAELKAEIDADVAAAKTALEAAYKAADAALKSGYEAADAALKTELQNKINEAVKAAQDANDALADTFEKALNQMKGSIDETNSMINDVVVPYFQGEIAKINTAITALQAADLKNADDIAKVAADLATAKTELTAAYEAAIKTAVDKLEAEITKNAEAIAALTTLHKNDVALLQAAIAENSDDITALLLQLNEFKSEYKTTVDLLQGAIAEGDEAVRQQLTNALNAHIEVYETTVDQLQGAMAEGDEAVRQELKNALNALDELHKTDVANLQAAIAENTTLAEGIRTQLFNHMAEYKATIEQLENQVTANEGEIAMLKVRALAVEAQVEALQALHATDMENIQNVLNNLEVAIQQETAQRQAAIEELDAKHTLANEEILAYVGQLEHQIRLNAAAIKNIKAGKQTMSVFIDGTLLAAKTVELLDSINAGAPIAPDSVTNNEVFDVPTMLYDPLPITADNYTHLIDVGFYTDAEVNG